MKLVSAISKPSLKTLEILSILAGLLYSSWPLGHWLNLNVSKNSLASGLEAVGQPYNWVFIGGDMLSSVIVIAVSLWLWRRIIGTTHYRSLKLTLTSTILFGVCTIVDAMLPLRCVQGVQTCPTFRTDNLLLTHGIFSILASFFLFISLCILWFNMRRHIILNMFLIGYIAFGAISLIQAIQPGKNGNWSQDYYITLCTLWIVAIPLVVNQLATKSHPSPDKFSPSVK